MVRRPLDRRRADLRRGASAAGLRHGGRVAFLLGGAADLALAYALTQVGTPYRTAGESPGGFDCSGLLWWAFGQAGLEIPRSSGDIYDDALRIPRRAAAPGDIVSFHGEGHVGLYLGGGLYVHSTRSGDVVRVSPLSDRTDLDGFVRISA